MGGAGLRPCRVQKPDVRKRPEQRWPLWLESPPRTPTAIDSGASAARWDPPGPSAPPLCPRPESLQAADCVGPAAPSVGRDRWSGRDRSPESVVIPAVPLPERFRAVLRLRRRPRPISPAGLHARRDYKRRASRFPDVAEWAAAQPLVSDSLLRRRNAVPPQSAQAGMRPALTKWVSAPHRSQTSVPGPVTSPA